MMSTSNNVALLDEAPGAEVFEMGVDSHDGSD